MTGERVKVLYIAGSGRSGSTILDRILGQLDGFFSVGELCNLWDRGLLAHRKCGCGVPVDQCPTWTGILATGFGRQLDQADAGAAVCRVARPQPSGRSACRAPGARPAGRGVLVAPHQAAA